MSSMTGDLEKYKKLYGTLDSNKEVNQMLQHKEKELKSLATKLEAAQLVSVL